MQSASIYKSIFNFRIFIPNLGSISTFFCFLSLYVWRRSNCSIPNFSLCPGALKRPKALGGVQFSRVIWPARFTTSVNCALKYEIWMQFMRELPKNFSYKVQIFLKFFQMEICKRSPLLSYIQPIQHIMLNVLFYNF